MEATTIEQSKRLLQLGIDPKTADLVYPAWTLSETPTEDVLRIIDGTLEENDVPAWSLSALLTLISKRGILWTLRSSPFDHKWYVSCDLDDMWKQIKANSPFEAAYKMTAWLLVNVYV